jgi:carnitine-CoA ligase
VTRTISEVESLIRQSARERPDDVWLKFRDDEYKWREVLSLSQRAANGLLRIGIRPSERIGLMAQNSPEFLWLYFGILMIGAHVVLINRWQRGPALEHMILDSGVVAIAHDDDLAEIIAPIRTKAPNLRKTISINGPRGRGADEDFVHIIQSPDTEPDVHFSDAPAAVGIIYTSGTTGRPKGIVSDNYEPLFFPVIEATGVRPGETMYACLPLFHANALVLSTIGSIRLKAKLALAERFSASQFIDDCRRYNAVVANALGAMMPMIIKQPARSDDSANPLRVILSVGCPASAWRECEERFGLRIIEFYGMSDAAGNLVNVDGKVGSVGKPIAGAEYRIADENDRPLPPGSSGEIQFRHPLGQMTHYHNLAEETAKSYRDGWFHSGDMGEMDKDGYFYFRGRLKEAIRRRGENISAWEIETVVDMHPKIKESAAFGVPSELGEEEVMLAVVLKPDVQCSPEEILAFCEDRLAYFAMPRFVELVDSLPKTGTQKVQHSVLKGRGRSKETWDREKAGYVLKKSAAANRAEGRKI